MSKWWGYVSVAPDPRDTRTDPPRAEWLLRPTAGGSHAQAAWRDVLPLMEERWRSRFGEDRIAALRSSLRTIVRKLDLDVPDFLPMVLHRGGRPDGK